jgi:hypothetical protein
LALSPVRGYGNTHRSWGVNRTASSAASRAGGGVDVFGHAHGAVGSPLQQRGPPELDLSRVTRPPQLARRLVGLALLGDGDEYDVVFHPDLPPPVTRRHRHRSSTDAPLWLTISSALRKPSVKFHVMS